MTRDKSLEAAEEVRAGGVEQVVAREVDLLDELEAALGAVGHRHGDGAVQLDDR